MNGDFAPILVVSAIPYEGGIKFLHREAQICIEGDVVNKLWRILSFTNGYNSIAFIAKAANLPEDEVSEILSELRKMELVVDSREQFLHFHRISNYPTTFNSTLSQREIEAHTASKRLPVKSGEVLEFKIDTGSALYDIREKRRSCRSFSEKKLTESQIGNICHYGYSIPDHSVPSGGALYPLKIYVLIERDQEGIGAGYYEYDADRNSLVLFDSEVDEEQLKYCFNQEGMPFGSSVQIIIAADLARQTYKYANRGYRLTLIEAGHVAENMNLYCAEQGLGACELGGVQDEPMKSELRLNESVWPMLAISVGYPADSGPCDFNKVLFVEENTGENHAVKEAWANTFSDNGSFFGAAAAYIGGGGDIQYAGATSPSYADAIFKATVEAYERILSSQVRVDFRGPARQLNDRWLDPKLLAPLTNEQAKRCGVTPFSVDLPINWTKGISLDGSEVYVPSDVVYYGYETEDERIYFGHSSGIAAHFSFKEARRRALIELVERDALMRNWYTRKAPGVIAENILPTHAKRRTQHWAERGREMKILQLPSDYGWVFEVVIVSDEYPAFVSGAAAAVDDGAISNAINKALQEAEYSLLLALKESNCEKIDPREVSTPADHGKLYCSKANATKISWLWNGNVLVSFNSPRYRGMHEIERALDVVTVDLSKEGFNLRVARVFSPKLVPINFGFDSAHYTHPSLAGVVDSKSLEMPHYFA